MLIEKNPEVAKALLENISEYPDVSPALSQLYWPKTAVTVTNNGTLILTSNGLRATDVVNDDAQLQFTRWNTQY